MIWDEYSIQKPVSEDALPVYLEASPDSSLSNSCRNRGMCRSTYIDSRSCRTHSYLSTLRVIDEHTGTTLFHHGGHIYTGSFRGYLPAMSSFLTLETGFQHCLHERCFPVKKEKNKFLDLPCHISQEKSGKTFWTQIQQAIISSSHHFVKSAEVYLPQFNILCLEKWCNIFNLSAHLDSNGTESTGLIYFATSHYFSLIQ